MENEMMPEKEMAGVAGEKKVAKEALLLAGTILLGSLIIAGAILSSSLKGAVPAVPQNGTADQAAAPAKVTVTMDQVKALFNSKNITFGNKDSKVLFVEFSDPSCPFCHVAAGKNPNLNKQMGAQFMMTKDGGSYLPPVPEMKKLVDAGKAGFVWMYANGHGNGEMGTKALYCAKEKGKFWEAHDLLMSEAGYTLMNTDVKNDKAKAGVVADFLKSAVNANDMKTCLESGKYDTRTTEDMAVAQQFGFGGTPNFFVNTDNFVGAKSFSDLQATVEKYLK